MTKEKLLEMHGWLLEKIPECSAGESQKTILEARLNGSKKQFEMGMLDGEEFIRVLAQIEKEVKAFPPLDFEHNMETAAVAIQVWSCWRDRKTGDIVVVVGVEQHGRVVYVISAVPSNIVPGELKCNRGRMSEKTLRERFDPVGQMEIKPNSLP